MYIHIKLSITDNIIYCYQLFYCSEMLKIVAILFCAFALAFSHPTESEENLLERIKKLEAKVKVQQEIIEGKSSFMHKALIDL